MASALRSGSASRLSLFATGVLFLSLSAPLHGEPRVRFLDAEGHPQVELLQRQRYQVEVEDPSWDQDPDLNESFEVPLWYPTTPEDYFLAAVEVHETGLGTGVFRGSFTHISITGSCPFTGMACFEHFSGAAVVARHTPRSGTAAVEARARVILRSLTVVDNSGLAMNDVLEAAPFRVRLTEARHDPYQVESRVVTVGSDLGGDLETLLLIETAAYSGIFEKSLPTRYVPSGSFGTHGDGELALGADPPAGVVTGETVTLLQVPSFGPPIEATVPVVAARLSVLDRGQPAAAILLGDQPRVLRLERPGLTAAGLPASFDIASGSDSESFSTAGNSRGVFDLALPFGSEAFLPGDGVVGIEAGSAVTFRHLLAHGHSGELAVALPVAGTQLRFVDATSGAALANTPDLRPFKVQWIESGLGNDNASVETRSVSLSTEMAGDLETFQLTETAPGSNVFETAVEPRIEEGARQPGVLEVIRRPSAFVGLYDSVTATVAPATDAPVSAFLPLTGPRVAWTNAQGDDVTEITYDSLAYLLIDDPLLDTDAFVAETVTVAIDGGFLESESVVLTETGARTGIFRGSIPVAPSYVIHTTVGNGILELTRYAPARVVYSMPDSLGSISKDVALTEASLELTDLEGNSSFYLEGDTLVLHLHTSFPGSSPTTVDEIEVEVRSLHWSQDAETITLVELGPNTDSYYGTLTTVLAPAEQGNGILEIGRGAFPEKILAVGGGARATASFSTGFLRFVDRLGREISSLSPGQHLGVELIRHLNDPAIVDTLPEAIRLTSPQGSERDEELLTLVETGADTGIFRAFLPTRHEPPQIGNGIAEVAYQGATVRAVFDDGADLLSAELPLRPALVPPPTANSDTLVIAPGTWGLLDVLANDVSGDGSTLMLGAATGGSFTIAEISPGGLLAIFANAGAEGSDVVTYLVTDGNGMISEGEVHVEIGTAPVVTILDPPDGAVISGPFVLRASASDLEDGDLSGQIAWFWSGHGGLTYGPEVTATLPLGSHVIVAMVSDSDGLTTAETVTVSIVANRAPAVTITAPSAGLRAAPDDAIFFAASAVDPESGDISAGLVWTSSLAGQIGSGASFSTSGLGVGMHTVQATVADPSGLTGSASVQVEVKAVATATFVSIGPEDGFVLESGENTGVGGLASTGQLRLGDNLADRQYRSFLSFNTSPLPDGALIRKVTVRAQRSGVTGTNPATTHGDLRVDVKHGVFGGSAALQNADFEDAATAAATCVIVPAPANGGWSMGVFDAAGRDAVHLEGTTQLRLYMTLDDDDDGANDYLDHYGGESTSASTRPQLIVEYLP